MSRIVHVDAKWHGGVAGIGVVVMRDGRIVESHSFFAEILGGSDAAERAAIRMAMKLFPGLMVYSDSTSAAAAEGAIWIPRMMNVPAHKAAARGYQMHEGPGPAMPAKKTKRKARTKYRRWKGRGVIDLPERATHA